MSNKSKTGKIRWNPPQQFTAEGTMERVGELEEPRRSSVIDVVFQLIGLFEKERGAPKDEPGPVSDRLRARRRRAAKGRSAG